MPNGQGGQPSIGELIQNVGAGLEAVTKAIMGSGAPDEVKQQMQAVLQGYAGIVQTISGGGGQQGQQAPQGQPVPQNAPRGGMPVQ